MISTKNAKYAKRFEKRDCRSCASEYRFFLVHIIPHPLFDFCTILLSFIEVYELFRLNLYAPCEPETIL